MRLTRSLIVCALLALSVGGAPAGGQEWPQWRGSERDGRVGFEPPDSWPAGLEPAWSVEVGTGHSSPLVQGGRVYLFSRLDEREGVSALRLADGQVVWRRDYEAPYAVNPAAAAHGKGPKSTPVVAGGRLFTLGISGILSAFEAAEGRLLWRHDFSGRFETTSPLYGASMSPLVDGERLIAHVGGGLGGALKAFDVASGEELWSWEGDGPAYASPVIGVLDGVRQVVAQTQSRLVGVDPATGELLWSRPFETPWLQNAVTPLIHDGMVVASGLAQGIAALRPRRGESGWSVEEVWRTREASLYMSSPVPAGGRICGFSHLDKGKYFCLDPLSGRIAWQGEGRGGDNAALLAAGEWVLGLNDDAELVVFRATADSFAPVAAWEVADSPTWAHPVLLPDGVLIKDKTRLTRYRFAARAPASEARLQTTRPARRRPATG